ncbi:MAG TPA: sulfatase [Bryobacteraceae bacterium]|nr:sulfatase [Bryobacteraceae bacterium]
MTRRDFHGLALGALGGAASAAAPAPPNVILIYFDDLGYGDLGCYGGSIPTPNIDRLAAQGMRFTYCDSANPVCSPSRAALLTGRYPTRTGVPRVLGPKATDGLNTDEKTLADLLKGKGYRTACVGKWHLGTLPQYLPAARGFDQYFGIPYSNDMDPRVLMQDTRIVENPAPLDTLTQRYTDFATRFIDEAKQQPFFLYFPHTYPHIPLGVSDRFRGKSPLGIYGDVVTELDWSVGEVMAALKRNGLDKNTLVLLSSDNGPWYQGSPGKLRGRKGMNWEGGVREPFLARWPGRIPAGKVCSGVVSTMDIFPTVARLCQAPLPAKPMDGIDIWPLLSGAAADIPREPLLYFESVNLECARWKNWKLHLSRSNTMKWSPAPASGLTQLLLPRPELYDLSRDFDESYDVAAQHPDVVQQMTSKVEEAMTSFPPGIRAAWEAIKQRQGSGTATGAVPKEK